MPASVTRSTACPPGCDEIVAFNTMGDTRPGLKIPARAGSKRWTPGHVGAMVQGQAGSRPLDDPAHDDLFATPARLHQPIFIHPHDPTNPAADR